MFFKRILIIIILPVFNIVSAQTVTGKKHYAKNNTDNSSILSIDSNKSKLQHNQTSYTIPVKFWIIRSNKNDKAVGPKQLKELIQYLNYYYSINKTGINFSLRPDFEYIDNQDLLKLRYYSQAPYQAFKRNSKACINVIITGNLIKKKFLNSGKKKFAGTYNPFFKAVIISRNTSTSTLSHEIGHYLGLKHPHQGWKHKWFQEPVSREKTTFLCKKKMCERKGDKLCDTPAEPNLTKYTDKNCNYTGWNVTDKYGEVYKPDTHNIMSYTNNRECRNKFTAGQISVMRTSLAKNKYAEFWRTDIQENKKYLPDAFEPDNYKETATEIFFNTPQIHSFHSCHTGKNKTDIPDTTDWLFFDLKTKKPQIINIEFSYINNLFTEIKISIFKDSTLISEKKYCPESKSGEIKILKAFPGKYTIKIQQTVETKQESFYEIMIKK